MKRAARRVEASQGRSRNSFGTGERGGNRNWSAPVHGTTAEGQDVTASFGQGTRSGETLISDGHVSESDFYGDRADGQKGHDHFGPDGSTGTSGDRGRSR